MKSESNDVYTRVTDQIIKAIEAGAAEWRMPWHISDSWDIFPVNAQTKKPYRGVNVVALWATAEELGYPSGIWGTYRQWSEMGAQVRKGEKSSHIVFWKTSGSGAETEEEGDESRGTRLFAKHYSVFNAAQVDGFTPPVPPELPPPSERIERADDFFHALGADIRHGGNVAFYRMEADYIQMPRFEAFPEPLGYYAILAHEAVHWTGAKSRLNRDLGKRFGLQAQGMEELIAELGAAFLCGSLRLSNEPRPDHAAYIANWLEVLKADKRAIFTAASKAQAATDWMEQRQARKIAA